jgi:hypothetical protein
VGIVPPFSIAGAGICGSSSPAPASDDVTDAQGGSGVRRLLLGPILLLCVCAPAAALAQSSSSSHASAVRRLGAQVAVYQQATWRWQRITGEARAPSAGRNLAAMSVEDVRGALVLWRRRAARAWQHARHPPHLRAWQCIHRYEATWNDAGAPYYGGLQMDYTFMRRYGATLLARKGTADHWTPLEQIWVAERARSSGRGFFPWPNTARICGLL